jgi:hypothetical protein
LGYLAFRLTKAFGFADPSPIHAHHPSLLALPANLVDLLHHYAGRYAARNALYGFYKFPDIEAPWLAAMVALDLAAVVALWALIRRVRLPSMHSRLLLLALVGFLCLALPILLNVGGGVGGRHLVLPSVGVVIALVWLCARMERWWRPGLATVMIALLVVCQGNAWSQVIACRINAALYETMRERSTDLARAQRVVVDTRSFADRIPFTMVTRTFNVLNTYYGAQAFEEWGIASQVRLVTWRADLPVFIAIERPQPLAGGERLQLSVLKHTGYRAANSELVTIPREGTVVLGFDEVYGSGFRHGKRLKRVGSHAT